MKRVILLVLMILILAGCAATETELPAAEEKPLLCTQGVPWDKEGTLEEIILNVPGGLQFSNMIEFDGDLLLWSFDDHLEDCAFLEFCLISLQDGTVLAQRDVMVDSYTFPQPLGENLYICDNYGGHVLKLSKDLQDIASWDLEPNDNSWYYGEENIIYQIVDGSYLWEYHLDDGDFYPTLEGNPTCNYFGNDGSFIAFEYYKPDTGAANYTTLNLLNGDMIQPEKALQYGYISISGDVWLSSRMNTPYHYRFGSGFDVPVQFQTEGYYAELQDEKRLLLTSEDGRFLHLFDLNGKAVSSCHLSETGYCTVSDLVWCEEQNGYYMLVFFYENDFRLLFWDVSVPALAENLQFEPIPEPSEAEAQLLRRCEQIGTEYGVSILIGNNCETEFFDFSAAAETDWTLVAEELDVVEEALNDYPDGFFRQFRRKSAQGVQIQLVADLQPHEGSGYTGAYAAFVENQWNRSIVVVDIEDSDITTYYHEFSHVIDDYLQWDSWEREDTLYSEEAWNAMNPGWFDGYTYDYGSEALIHAYGYFVDSYSTISPTEDRARVMEHAMGKYGNWTFEDAPALRQKLDYYCRCIRNAFDTEGWPAVTVWEQYLNTGIG